MTLDLGPFGFTVDNATAGSHLGAATEIERLGFGALWVVGGQLDRLDRLTDLLGATEHATVGSAIIPPEVYDAATVTRFVATVDDGDRLLLGFGSPHTPRPLAALREYLTGIDDAVPPRRRVLAALGPRALELARDRFAGAVPMLFTPEYTAVARARLGDDRLLVVGLDVVLDDDPAAARATARHPLSFLLSMPPYRRSLIRQGFSDEDLATMSDRMVDAITAWGTPADIVARAREHLDAGADHVQLTVIGTSGQPTGLAAARLLAPEIG